MVVCSVVNCSNKSELQNCREHGISYFRFRTHNIVAWARATGRGDSWVPLASSSICSEHFDVSCFEPVALRRRLHHWAVPTLKLPPQHGQNEDVKGSAKPEKSEDEPRTYKGPKTKPNEEVPEAGAARPMDPSELERFKRRLIRTVARFREEKCFEWVKVEQNMGKSCRSMWARMRLLTLKKMSRLLHCNDLPAQLSPVARLSITDWLLLDLVLVHEDIDSTHSTGEPNGPESRPLATALRPLAALLELVQEFDLEHNGTAENWARAAIHYNQRGRQCSPMLLQRRWFDLKLLARKRFYHYWDMHRRDPEAVQPSKLDIEIARRYPHVVTKVLPSWNEMRISGRVILPNEFEKILRFNQNPKEIDEDPDDVVLIEPNIETIDVDLVSELEEAASEIVTECNTEIVDNSTDNSAKKLIENELANLEIKKEEINPEYLEIEDSEFAVDAENDEINIFENYSTELLQTEKELYPDSSTGTIDHESNKSDCQHHVAALPVILKVESVVEDRQTDVQNAHNFPLNIRSKRNDSVISENISICGEDQDCIKPEIIDSPSETIEGCFDTHTQNSLVQEDLEHPQPIIPLRPGPKSMKKILSTNRKTLKVIKKAFQENTCQPISDRPGPKCSKSSLYIEVNSGSFSKLLVRDSVSPISPVMDGEARSHNDSVDFPKSPMTKEASFESDAPKPSTSKEFYNQIHKSMSSTSIDEPVVFEEFNECDSDFTDDGNEEAVHIDEAILKSIQQQHINTVLPEEKDNNGTTSSSPISVPSSPLAFRQEDDSSSIDEHISPKFDLKLLMLPVVYTKKLDDMEIFKTKFEINCTVFNSVASHEEIETQSKPKSSKGVELNIHQEMDYSNAENVSDVYAEECLNDNDNYAEVSNANNREVNIQKEIQVIKESSYHFQKPIARCYTPINLCKNPDFNTRLRRLSVAFYMKARNRQLIKACKPLTVDVQKTFEEKLVAGMLLLKRSDKKPAENTDNNIVTNDIDCQSVTVTPSAMPAQSLFDKEKVDINELTKVVKDSKQIEDVVPLKARQSKSINLPDIEKVRLINKQLLTAQVPPLQVSEQNTTEDRVEKNKHKLQRPTEVYEVLRGPQGVEYKRQDDTKIKDNLKIKEPKPKTKDLKRKISKPLDVPWYHPDYRKISKENYLLKEDALQRMIVALTPEAVPYKGTVRKHSYCCTAKRHKVLNDARCRLLITTQGKLQRRKFQKELKIHKCLPQECKCCCKSLLPEQEPKTSPELQPREESEIEMPTIQQALDPDSEIANALAGLEPTLDPSPVPFPEPAVGLAPIVKTPQKQQQDPETPTKSPPNDVHHKSISHSVLVPTKSHDFCTGTENDKENPKEGVGDVIADVIELDDDSDQDAIEYNTVHSDTVTLESANNAEDRLDAQISKHENKKNGKNVDKSTDFDMTQGSVDKSIDLCEVGENKLPTADLQQVTSIPKTRRRQVRKKKDKSDTISGGKKAQLRYWENVKETSKTAYGFNIKKGTHPKIPTRVIMPQMVPQNKICDTSPYNAINEYPSPSSYTGFNPSIAENTLDFPPGTKFMLLTNGQVFATTADGIPIPLTESQYAALQLVINNVHGQSNVPTQNMGISDETASTIGTLSANGQVESYFPSLEINDSNSSVNSDQLLVNTAHEGVSIQSKTSPRHKKLGSTTDAQVIDNTNISIIKELKQSNHAATQVSGEENESTMEVPDNATALIEIADSPENNTSCIQDNSQTTSNKFLTVKNFAKMPLTKTDSQGSQNQSSVPTNKNSILSDLMEISGISSEDTNVPTTTDLGVTQCLGVVQEWTSVGSNDPNSLVLTPNMCTQLNTVGPKGQFYMYNSVTGQVSPISVVLKSPVKQNIQKVSKKTKSTINVGVVEVSDSESETPAATHNPLLKLLKRKKKLKRVFVIKPMKNSNRNLPSILKKQSTLGKYEHAKYSEFNMSKQSKKKRKKIQVEAKIDLVDSDAPMEEEYLVDSQESDTGSNSISNIRTRSCMRKRHLSSSATISVDIDDSSDDEPLSKIAAKKIAEKLNVSPAITESPKNGETLPFTNTEMIETRNATSGSPLESIDTENVVAQDDTVSEDANPNILNKNKCNSFNHNESMLSNTVKSLSKGPSDKVYSKLQAALTCNVNYDNSTIINVVVQETESNVTCGDINAVCENYPGITDNAINDHTDSQHVNCLNVNPEDSAISNVFDRETESNETPGGLPW